MGGENRKYFITLPKNYDNNKPHKVLFALHCYGSNGEDFVHHAADYDHPTPYYGQQVLDKNGDYIFVSLDAIGGLWNKGQADHDFFAQTLTTLNENYCIDTSRVFITGFSYGAMFSYSLAQDMQTRVRAAATYAVADYNIWLPEGDAMKELPIAWMNVHGVNDDRCDYNRAKTSALLVTIGSTCSPRRRFSRTGAKPWLNATRSPGLSGRTPLVSLASRSNTTTLLSLVIL